MNSFEMIEFAFFERSLFMHLLVWVTLTGDEVMVCPRLEHSIQNCSSLYPNKESLFAITAHGLPSLK